MKVWVDWDEWYPVYDASSEDSVSCYRAEGELSEAEWEDYSRVCREFHYWQARLKGLVAAGLAKAVDGA